MTWDVTRARRSERRWKLLAAGLLLVPVLLLVSLSALPYVWSWTAWQGQVAAARDVRDYDRLPEGATFDQAEKELGKELFSGPGFESAGSKQAGVYYWRTDAGEVRALVIRDRIVGRPKVGVWR